MKLLFLDIDGVLNDHKLNPAGVGTIMAEHRFHLNRILEEVPDLQIVVSSAWRYLILRGEMTVKGFERLLESHGVRCRGRVHGCTVSDAEVFEEPPIEDIESWSRLGLSGRVFQIRLYVAAYKPDRYVILDDLALECDELVCTTEVVGTSPGGLIQACRVGLTQEHADEVIRRFLS
jgi:hypothetical protein